MRLIDAEELHELLNWTYESPPYSRKKVRRMIDNARTVDAVPFEWIENYLRNYRYMAPIEKCFVREMIKVWAERREDD